MNLQEALKTISAYTSKFPAEAISVIRENKDDAIDGLIDIIKQAFEINKDEESDLDTAVAALLLSEFKEKRAFEYFMKYIYEGDDFCETFLGDVFWEYFPCILANTVSADKIDDLKKCCEAFNDNWLLLDVIIGAFLMICVKNIISYDELIEYIEYIAEKYPDNKDMATIIASNIRHIYSEKIEKFVINAFENENIDLMMLSRLHAEEDINFAKDKDASERLKDYTKDHPDYITAECIENWYKNSENSKDGKNDKVFWREEFLCDIYAIDGEPEYALRKVLSSYNTSIINKILHSYDVEKEWKYSRSQIEDIIFNKITNYDNFVYNMNNISSESFKKFCKYMKKEQYSLFLYDSDIMSDFIVYGLLNLFRYNGKFYISVCGEVRELYNKYMENKEREKYKRRFDVGIYAESAVNLYGVITLNRFCEIFNNYNKMNYEPEYIRELLNMNEGGYYIDGEFLVNNMFEDNFKPYFLNELKEKAKNTEAMYLPGKSVFLKYDRWNYFIYSNEYKNMARFIYSMCDDIDDVENIVNITNEIYLLAIEISEYDNYTSLLSSYEIYLFREEDENKFLSLYKAIDISVRKWINKGFRDLDIKHSEAVPVKVGRNDPCPCGSGKKYKKCCGK